MNKCVGIHNQTMIYVGNPQYNQCEVGFAKDLQHFLRDYHGRVALVTRCGLSSNALNELSDFCVPIELICLRYSKIYEYCLIKLTGFEIFFQMYSFIFGLHRSNTPVSVVGVLKHFRT